MSQANRHPIDDEGVAEADVASYLQSHPEFFERHLQLLRTMQIPHRSGNATVSLIERQVSVLRQRNDELERQLNDLFDVAKANNELIDQIHKLAIAFVRQRDIDSRLETLEAALREDFAAERAVLVIFRNDAKPEITRQGLVKLMDRDDETLKSFSTFLRSARARCGPLRDKQKELLFDREADTIASAALVPIGEGARLGFLAVGSKDPNQFHPGQRVDFLGRLGELVEIALENSDAADAGS